MKKFSESLREHVMEINSSEKKKTWLLTKKSSRNHMKMTKSCLICKEKFENKYVKDKNIVKLEIIVIIQRNIEVLRIAYVI